MCDGVRMKFFYSRLCWLLAFFKHSGVKPSDPPQWTHLLSVMAEIKQHWGMSGKSMNKLAVGSLEAELRVNVFHTFLKLLKWMYSRICDSNTFSQAKQVTWIMKWLYPQPAACEIGALLNKQFWRWCPAVRNHTVIWPVDTCWLVC